jgi:hypothetical protein
MDFLSSFSVMLFGDTVSLLLCEVVVVVVELVLLGKLLAGAPSRSGLLTEFCSFFFPFVDDWKIIQECFGECLIMISSRFLSFHLLQSTICLTSEISFRLY